MMTSSSASTGTENVKQSISVPINAATDGEIVASRADIAKSLVPEIRVLESVSSKTSDFQHPVQNSHQLHLQQVHVLKAVAADDTVPRGSGLSIKTTNTSPLKGPTVLTLPFHKIAQNSKLQTRLQVGDTLILSPASTLACEHTLESVSVVSEKSGRIMFSTPTKLHMKTSAVTEQPAQRTSLTQCHLGPFTSSVSPAHHSSVSASPWASSPIQYKRGKEHRQQEILSDIIKKARRTPGTDKGSKGLRHFAMLVCEKVKQKITTTYNEVADELVTEYSNSQKQLSDQQYDQKNIRRRVYDALNVLMAMNIIYKDKKDIHWVGLPTNSAQELKALESEKHKRELRVKQKTAQLHELILQQIAFKNLVQRNRRSQQTQGPPASNSAIQLPFIVVNTGKKTVIDCSISNDKYEYLFNFDNTFEIHDDIEVLKRMGLAYGLENGTCKREDLRVAQSLVPPVLKPHLEEMAGFSRVNTSLGDSSSPSLSLESSHYSCSASETAHTCFGEPKFHASVGSQGNRREKESCMAENENRLHSDCNLAVIPEDITAHADAFNFPPTAPTS